MAEGGLDYVLGRMRSRDVVAWEEVGGHGRLAMGDPPVSGSGAWKGRLDQHSAANNRRLDHATPALRPRRASAFCINNDLSGNLPILVGCSDAWRWTGEQARGVYLKFLPKHRSMKHSGWPVKPVQSQGVYSYTREPDSPLDTQMLATLQSIHPDLVADCSLHGAIGSPPALLI
jgi:hypothetical protein